LGIALTSGNNQEEVTDLFRLQSKFEVKSLSRIRTLYTAGCEQELTSGNPQSVPDTMLV